MSDGSLEVCGRCDTAVRIRGYMVELEAVKTILSELPNIVDACVQAYGAEGEEKTLVAFIVPKEDFSVSNREIRSLLKTKLPFYMIPSRFILLQWLPVLEVSGKLDMTYLAGLYSELKKGSLEVTKIVNGEEQTVTAVEKEIAHIWSALLNVFVVDTDESFFDLGGHSLLAASLASQLNDRFAVSLTAAHVFKNPTISALATLVTSTPGEQLNEKIDLCAQKAKLQIDFNGIDMQMRSFWQTVHTNPNRFSKANVLLTGATGYVGCFLLEELLLHTQTAVYCLVRESPELSPLHRLQEARYQFGLRRFLPPDRVIPVKGDVSLNQLGLSKDMYNALCLEVDVVIHAAAQVNLILPFNALYTTNVLGTQNVLIFSLKSKIKPIHYISTNGVFPTKAEEIKEDVDMCKICDQLDSGYGQTKWLAEQVIQSAINRGFPAAIYRCGNVGGSRLVAGWNPSDFNLHLLKGVLKTSVAPDLDYQIELTPVDFVSKVIIHLVCNLHQSAGKVFHLINKSTIHCKDLWSLLNHLGFKVTTTSYSEWKQLVIEKSEGDKQLAKLAQLLTVSESLFSATSTFGQENVMDVLKTMNSTYPLVSQELLTKYIEDLSSIGVLPKAIHRRGNVDSTGKLKGKVVVITGASSGIGEGIARTLARAGARLVLAARRLERLQKIADELKSVGAEAIPVKMDICDAEQVASCIEGIESTIGPIDVLVNNAGVMYWQFFKKCDLPRWHHMVDVNIKGTLNCLAATVGKMAARGSGHIINISSDGARKPFAGLAVYCGTKYFIRCLSGAVRSELASSGVKVTDIQPGDVTSELHNTATDPEAELTYDWSTKVPILKPSDVGEAVLYTLSQPSYCAINEILLEPELLPVY